ncbi:hypothetical protein VTL71DRAFT_9312 [Oculimacula yallundae]|uniref:Uncharacterized protein n=1 Tax=Oculimacula yallundae TaxID=86028 RepID=A0ABR4BSQ1_9HELO
MDAKGSILYLSIGIIILPYISSSLHMTIRSDIQFISVDPKHEHIIHCFHSFHSFHSFHPSYSTSLPCTDPSWASAITRVNFPFCLKGI